MKKSILCLLLLAALVLCLSGCKSKTPAPPPDGEVLTEDGTGAAAADSGEVNPGTVGYYPNAAPEQPLTPVGAENTGQPEETQPPQEPQQPQEPEQIAEHEDPGEPEEPQQIVGYEDPGELEEPQQIVGYEDPTELEGAKIGTCTISISCSTILNNMDKCDPAKAALVPATGWILAPAAVSFEEGESVFTVLQRTCQQNGIHMEFSNAPMYNSAYIEGIGNLYEFDVGELSGWMYSVNGVFPNYGCSKYILQNGDTIRWVYTCDQGADVGGSNFS